MILFESEELPPDEDDLFGTSWLRRLCPLPHRLQKLEEIDLGQHRLRLDHMELLQQLPALTALEPEMMFDTALPLLPAFAARLKRLRLCIAITIGAEVGPELFDFDSRHARGPLFLPHLTPCAALTQLTPSKCVFVEAEAATLCQALPMLKQMDLSDVGWPSFESLRHLPLLGSFSLQRSRGHPLCMKAEHFEPLQQLRSLTLIDVHPHRDTIAALRPPSALLPALAEFRCTPQ